MDDVFLKIVNLSISASWLILTALVLRVVLKKAPKWVMPLLWGVVALRLVCPFSIESALSLIPSAETIPSEIMTETREPVLYEQATLDIVTNPTLPSAAEVPVGVSRQQAQVDFNIYSVLWLAGMAALLVHALVSAGKLKKKLATAILLRDNIYESEFVDSPFVFGVVKPNIYLPMHMDEGTAAHVIAHERAHLARRDHWWKVLGYLVLALHWFNPLVWVAYILFCRDIELACDEKVVKGLDGAARADYSQALLSCAAPKRAVAACPLAFGEGNIKTRVKSALHYKKPAFWVAAVAVLAVVLGAVLAAAYLDLSNFDSLRRALSYDKADAAGENTYDYDNDRTNRFALLGDRLLVVSTTRVSVLADDGSEVYAQEVKLDSPAIALGGRTAAVYDVGGTTLYILGERGLVRDLSTETENGIISAIPSKLAACLRISEKRLRVCLEKPKMTVLAIL